MHGRDSLPVVVTAIVDFRFRQALMTCKEQGDDPTGEMNEIMPAKAASSKKNKICQTVLPVKIEQTCGNLSIQAPWGTRQLAPPSVCAGIR